MTEYSARDLYLFCRSTYEIEQMREYARRHFDKDKSDYNLHGFFMTLSADCLRYREILGRLGITTQLIKVEGENVILDLQKQIQSQKEEIEKWKKEAFANHPTQWAYDQACNALNKKTAALESLQKENADQKLLLLYCQYIMEFHTGSCPMNIMNNFSGSNEHLSMYRRVMNWLKPFKGEIDWVKYDTSYRKSLDTPLSPIREGS